MEPSGHDPADPRDSAIRDGPVETSPLTETGEHVGEDATILGRASRSVMRWVGAVITLVVLAGLGLGGWALFQDHQKEVAAGQALVAAQNYMANLTSIDSNLFDDRSGDLLDGATGEFKDAYSRSNNQLRQLLIDNRAAARRDDC